MTRQYQQESDKDQPLSRHKAESAPDQTPSAVTSYTDSLSTAAVLRMQSTIGNQAVQRLISGARQKDASVKQPGSTARAEAHTVQRDPESRKNPNITVTRIPTPDQYSDELLAGDIIKKQAAILGDWKTALDNFQVVMTSASDAETKPNFQKVLFSFIEDKLFGELVKQIPEGAHAGDVFSLLGKLVDEAKRAGTAQTSAKLRDFYVDYNTRINNLKKKTEDTEAPFINDVTQVRERMLATDKRDEYSMMRMQLMEMWEAVYAEEQRSSPQIWFKMLSDQWLLSSTAGHVPAWVGIQVEADFSVRDAVIHGPGGQKIAEQLLKDSPDGVDVYHMPVPREIHYYKDPKGYPMTIRLDANGRLINNGTMLEGDSTLVKAIETHGLKPTKKVSGD